MIGNWGQALEAELRYRQEKVQREVHNARQGGSRRERGAVVPPAPCVPLTADVGSTARAA